MMKPFSFSKNKKINKDSFGYYKQLSFGGDFQQKYCYIPQIQLLSPDSLPRNPQTGKIKRVIVR